MRNAATAGLLQAIGACLCVPVFLLSQEVPRRDNPFYLTVSGLLPGCWPGVSGERPALLLLSALAAARD